MEESNEIMKGDGKGVSAGAVEISLESEPNSSIELYRGDYQLEENDLNEPFMFVSTRS